MILDGGGAAGTPVIPSFSGSTDWMAGSVTSYDPVTGVLVAEITSVEGTATYTAWNVFLAPTPGTSMILKGTSVTSLAIGTGAKTLTVDLGLDLTAGQLIYIIYSSAAGLNTTGMILTLASQQLQDETGEIWNVAVLVPYLNLFLLEVMNLKPEAYVVTQNIALIAGPAQSLPTGAIGLIDVISNMGTTGTTRGMEISGIEKDQLDDLVPGWMTFTANAVVNFVAVDDRTPKKFYVFPPQPSANRGQIEVVLSTPPTPLTSWDGTFPFDDSYAPAGVNYIVSSALGEQTTIPGAMEKSVLYYNKFLQNLGLKTNTEKQSAEKGK